MFKIIFLSFFFLSYIYANVINLDSTQPSDGLDMSVIPANQSANSLIDTSVTSNNRGGNVVNLDDDMKEGKRLSNPKFQATYDSLEKDITPNDLIEVRRKEEEISEALNKPLKTRKIENKKIKYKEGMIVSVNLLYGNPTLFEFRDEFKNLMEIEYISDTGGAFDIIRQDSSIGRIFITPYQKYATKNLLVGLKGLDYPIQITLGESTGKDSYANVVVFQIPTVYEKNMVLVDRIKQSVLDLIVKKGDITTYPSVDYEIWNMEQNKQNLVIFDRDMLNIYSIETLEKKFNVVIMHKMFNMEGYEHTKLAKYNNDYRIFLLDMSQSVFTIYSEATKERYRVVLK